MKKIKKSLCLLILASLLIIPQPVTAEDNKNNKEIYVTLGGEPFGLKMYTDGVYILKKESFMDTNGNMCCPADEAGLKSNDIIKKCNDITISSNEDLNKTIQESKGKNIKLTVERNDDLINIDITPKISEDGTYKTGMWIKDSAAGLGTISFYSKELDGFCGLGHGMIDNDTKELIPITTGEATFAHVSSVTKSSDGNVGTLNGYFLNKELGEFSTNSESGIYGTLTTEDLKSDEIKLGNKEEVKRGYAQIYTTVDGQTPRCYDAEIVMIKKYDEKTNIIVKITDTELLETTGGVVQGMSGSPIIQNDKLVGVLTHVLVNNVNYGYGIFAETMYDELKEVC